MKDNSRIRKNLLLMLTMTLFMISTLLEPQAQDKGPETSLTWDDLGLGGAPEGVSTDELVMIESLVEGRGTWEFEGRIMQDRGPVPIQGKMDITGSLKGGMLPMWALTLNWPREDPEHAIFYSIMVAPENKQIELMLFRIGPVRVGAEGKPTKDDLVKAQRIPFKGDWDLEHRRILWKQSRLPGKMGVKDEPDQLKSQTLEMESFEMILADNGSVTIQNTKSAVGGFEISGKTTARMGDPVVKETLAYNRDMRFATRDDVSEAHIKPYIPGAAVDITLNLQRNGHYALYKIGEKDFLKFLDDLWQGKEREKGVAVNQREMAKHFERLGWEPFENAISYNSPSKPNGAMSNYYYNAKTGMVFENTGYW
jgi:hypothetical protein